MTKAEEEENIKNLIAQCHELGADDMALSIENNETTLILQRHGHGSHVIKAETQIRALELTREYLCIPLHEQYRALRLKLEAYEQTPELYGPAKKVWDEAWDLYFAELPPEKEKERRGEMVSCIVSLSEVLRPGHPLLLNLQDAHERLFDTEYVRALRREIAALKRTFP